MVFLFTSILLCADVVELEEASGSEKSCRGLCFGEFVSHVLRGGYVSHMHLLSPIMVDQVVSSDVYVFT